MTLVSMIWACLKEKLLKLWLEQRMVPLGRKCSCVWWGWWWTEGSVDEMDMTDYWGWAYRRSDKETKFSLTDGSKLTWSLQRPLGSADKSKASSRFPSRIPLLLLYCRPLQERYTRSQRSGQTANYTLACTLPRRKAITEISRQRCDSVDMHTFDLIFMLFRKWIASWRI